MNICLTGLNKKNVKVVAEKVATALGYDFFDVDLEFEPELIKTIKLPIIEAEYWLNDKEREVLLKLSKAKNTVLAISAEMFLSNNNFKLLKNCVSFVLLEEFKDEVKVKLQQLLAKKCKYSVVSLDEIIKVLKK